MAPKAFKTLWFLVHFLIDESPGYSEPVTVYHFCRATEIFDNNINGQKVGDPNTKSGNRFCRDTIDLKNGGQKRNKIVEKKMDQKGNDKDRKCWYIEFTEEKCNKKKNCKSYAVSCTGGIVGAVLGGTVFGSVMTMIVFLCFFRAFRFLKIRNSDCKRRSYENLQESLPPVVTDTVYNEINDQAVIRIEPMRRPESAHVSPREETYSHLHESNKEDMNESYDNARPVPSACVREDGYEVMQRFGNNNREVQTTATDDVPSEIQNDNYFIIEPQ